MLQISVSPPRPVPTKTEPGTLKDHAVVCPKCRVPFRWFTAADYCTTGLMTLKCPRTVCGHTQPVPLGALLSLS